MNALFVKPLIGTVLRILWALSHSIPASTLGRRNYYPHSTDKDRAQKSKLPIQGNSVTRRIRIVLEPVRLHGRSKLTPFIYNPAS